MQNLLNYLNKKANSAVDTLKYFYKKEYCSTKKYAESFIDWTHESSCKNKIIHLKRDEDDAENVNRRRSEIFWIDFGVNIGSEFNFKHFCVVIKEFHRTAIIVPLSSVKENDAHWKNEENFIVNIGEIKGFPIETKEAYALVNQIKTVSKQRLSNYKHERKFLKIKLSNEQMDLIDNFIIKLTNKS